MANKEITKKIKKIMSSTKSGSGYRLDYDTFDQGLEPTYYWILDFLKEQFGFTVDKVEDYTAAAEASGYFSEMGGRRTAMEKRAGELMMSIGAIVKEIIKLIWDLKEFEEVLPLYKKYKKGTASEKEEADWGLKGIWLTNVDMRKGRGSINMLTTDANFVTMRDAFMTAKNAEDVDKLLKSGIINKRVQKLLKPRLSEYIRWIDNSYKELNNRYKIEKRYLKNQVATLNAYSEWVRPYLQAVKRLLPPEDLDEEVVSGFDVGKIHLSLLARKEIKGITTGRHNLKRPITTIKEYKELKEEHKAKRKKGKIHKKFTELRNPIILPNESDRVFAIVEVNFDFRGNPGKMGPKGGYIHRGKTTITFTPHVMSQKDIDKLNKLRTQEVLQFVDGITKDSLAILQEDLDRFLKEDDKEKPKEKKSILDNFISQKVIKNIGGLKKVSIKINRERKKDKDGNYIKTAKERHIIKQLEKQANKSAESGAWNTYEKFKKAHGMITW